MKKLLIPATCVLALALGVTNAAAAPLTTTDDAFLGTIIPGEPADEDSEIAYINRLLETALGMTETEIIDGHSHDFERSNNPCVGCPDATDTGANSGNDADGGVNDLDVSDFTYLLVKFGNDSYVWYIPLLDDPNDVDIPDELLGPGTGSGASHYSLYNNTPTTTPDGGATLGLLGLGILGLGYLRRRLG